MAGRGRGNGGTGNLKAGGADRAWEREKLWVLNKAQAQKLWIKGTGGELTRTLKQIFG